MFIKKVEKKNGGKRLEAFDPKKIYNALFKAFQAIYGINQVETTNIDKVYKDILKELNKIKEEIITVNEIDDVVEQVLALHKETNVLVSYIKFRMYKIHEKKIVSDVSHELNFTPAALNLLKQRYLFKDNNGNVIETPKQMFRRVAKFISLADSIYAPDIYDKEGKQKQIAVPKNIEEIMDMEVPAHIKYKKGKKIKIEDIEKIGFSIAEYQALSRSWFFNNLEHKSKKDLISTLTFIMSQKNNYYALYNTLINKDAIFNSPTLINAGRNFGVLSACFALYPKDDIKDILQNIVVGGLIYRDGGGVGYYFGDVRENGSLISTTKGKTRGPLSFMELFDKLGQVVKQAAVRDAAALAALPDWHPDVLEFIDSKLDTNKFTGFNISVTITRKFLKTLKNNGIWNLLSPKTGKVIRTVPAKDIWYKIINNAWKSAEPGILFVDEQNADNPMINGDVYKTTNPCITKDTWIFTTEGPKRVKDIIEKDIQLFVNGRKYKSNGFFETGIKKIYKVTTKEGFEIKATGEHPFLKFDVSDNNIKTEWTPLNSLSKNDVVAVNDCTNSYWQGSYTEDEGYLVSLLFNNVHFSKNEVIIYYKNKPLFLKTKDKIEAILQKQFAFDKQNMKYYIKSKKIFKLAKSLNINSSNYNNMTSKIEQTSPEFYIGFLRGLFDIFGNIQEPNMIILEYPYPKNGSIALCIPKFLQVIQRMLLRIGIYSIIEQDKIIIKHYDVKKFAESIGFWHSDKKKTLDNIISKYSALFVATSNVATIQNISYIGKKKVYNVKVSNIQAFDANGFIVHNCGEEPLFSKEACNLASINLSNMVKEDGTFNWKKFKVVIHRMVHYLDNVIDMNRFPEYGIYEQVRNYRRVGLGIMGYADMLIKLKMRYGSIEALRFTHKLGSFFAEESRNASSELAKNRGVFPKWNQSIFPKIVAEGKQAIDKYKPEGKGIAQYKFKRELWLKYPYIRNITVNTAAPTGSIGIVAGVSSSIEPIFSFVYTRRMLNNLMYVDSHPLFKEVLINNGIYSEELMDKVSKNISVKDIEEIPKELRHILVTTYDVTPEEHVYTQAVFQQYIDNSISKCLVEGQLMLTNKGIIPIERCGYAKKQESFDRPIKNLHVIDKNGELQLVKSHYNGGKKHCIAVRLNDGSVIKGAAETHKVMTIDGWKTLKNISVNDFVIVKHNMNPIHTKGNLKINYETTFRTDANILNFPKVMTPELAKWLGMLAADGYICTKRGRTSLIEKDEKVATVFDKLTQKLFHLENKVIVDQRNNVRTHFLTSRELSRYVISLIGKTSRDKHVPEQILMGSKEEKISFIEGLTLDGYYKNNYGLCIYDGRSERLAYEVTMLLRSFGLNRIYQGKKKDKLGTSYSVFVSNELQKLIHPIEKHKDKEIVWKKYYVLVNADYSNLKISTNHPKYRAFNAMRRSKRNYCYNTTAKQLNIPILAEIRKVSAVEDIGFQNVYDIEVENSHSYIVNGIVSHNTVNLPKDASPSDVENIYFLAAKHRCKGITVYRESSREGVILAGKKNKEVKETKKELNKIDFNIKTKVIAEEDYSGGCPTCHT